MTHDTDVSPNSTLTPDTPVGQLVAQRPARTRLLEKLGIDYCCGGGRSLAEACDENDLDPDTVIRMLQAMEASGVDEIDERDWTSAPIPNLIDHIESTHHAFLRRALPRLGDLLDKVVRVHGDEAPWLESVQEIFPFIRQRLGEEISADAAPIALGPEPMKMMEMEHDDAGEALKQIRARTDDYAIPEWACGTLRVTIDGLRELEKDTHQHVHKENNILFERARSLQAK